MHVLKRVVGIVGAVIRIVGAVVGVVGTARAPPYRFESTPWEKYPVE